jgi:flagellum-specific ATP synthase
VTNKLDELASLVQQLSTRKLVRLYGRVTRIAPGSVQVSGLSTEVRVGEFVFILTSEGKQFAQVIGIEAGSIIVNPSGAQGVIALGDRATPAGELKVNPDASWKGRMCNAMGEAIDGGTPLLQGPVSISLEGAPPPAMARDCIGKKIATGVKAVDVFTPICSGQRIGIFAGSGVGKSTLLAMLSKAPQFDCVVVALVGERGREVREFVQDVLGEHGKKAIIVVATSDEPPVMRKLAANLATSIAEYFRDKGEQTLLIMDSVTRYAQACREIALAAGEPPVARGFPPSVFSQLPFLLERAGPGPAGKGSITGIYTVLVDGDDHNDPVADTVRGTLDGHIVLDRAIAATGRYPAIDILQSISRLSSKAWSPTEANTVAQWKRLLMRYEDSRDLRALGGYVRGADPELDLSVIIAPRLYAAIEQSPASGSFADSFALVSRAIQVAAEPMQQTG